MTRQVYIEINGTRTNISDGAPLKVIELTNLGASAANRITERSPAQDGDTDIDRRLEPRMIQMVLLATPDTTYIYETIRALINRLFRATSVKIILGIEFDNGEVYHIDTQSVGDIELPFNLLSTVYVRAGVRLRAANPTFYDPIGVSITFAISGGGTSFTVPSFVPTFFGINSLDLSIPIAYTGTYKDYPVIQVYGPITDPVITNTSTGLKLDFTGFTVASGDVWTIDLRYGRKQVYRNAVPSDTQLYKLTNDSDIAQWAIEPDPIVVGGINVIRVTGTGLSALSQVYVQYYRRFDGI